MSQRAFRPCSFHAMQRGVKVAMFPGIVGINVAKEMTQSASTLDCDRLIIDLRGNTGGGMGRLRMMGLLCPEKIPVGYSLSRRGAARGYRRENVQKFDRIPSEKWELIPLLFRHTLGCVSGSRHHACGAPDFLSQLETLHERDSREYSQTQPRIIRPKTPLSSIEGLPVSGKRSYINCRKFDNACGPQRFKTLERRRHEKGAQKGHACVGKSTTPGEIHLACKMEWNSMRGAEGPASASSQVLVGDFSSHGGPPLFVLCNRLSLVHDPVDFEATEKSTRGRP